MIRFHRLLATTCLSLAGIHGALAQVPQATPRQNAENLLIRGQATLRNQQIPAAIDLFESALEADPTFREAYIELGKTLALDDRRGEAAGAFREALNIKPDDPDTLLLLGLALDLSGNKTGAQAAYKQILAADPKHFGALHELAMSELAAGNVKDAVTHMDAAAAQRPWDVEVRQDLGFAYLRAGQYDKAIMHLREVISTLYKKKMLNRGSATAYVQLADAYAGKKDYNSAIKAYQEAAKLDPALGLAWFRLGLIHKALGQPGEAITALRKAVELDLRDKWLFVALGATLAAAGDLAGAEEQFGRAVTFDNSFIEGYFNLGMAQKSLDKCAAAAVSLKRVVEIDPNHRAALGMLIECLNATNNTKELEAYEKMYLKTGSP